MLPGSGARSVAPPRRSTLVAPSTRTLAACCELPEVAKRRAGEGGLERRGREAGDCGRQEDRERTRGDGEGERRVEDDCLSVDACRDRTVRGDFELRGRPLAPALERESCPSALSDTSLAACAAFATWTATIPSPPRSRRGRDRCRRGGQVRSGCSRQGQAAPSPLAAVRPAEAKVKGRRVRPEQLGQHRRDGQSFASR